MLVSDLSVISILHNILHMQYSVLLSSVMLHFLLCYEIIHVALFSLSIAIQKTKHLNDCLVNLASYIFLTTFQYTCWELLESVYSLKTLNYVYVKWNTTLMI